MITYQAHFYRLGPLLVCVYETRDEPHLPLFVENGPWRLITWFLLPNYHGLVRNVLLLHQAVDTGIIADSLRLETTFGPRLLFVSKLELADNISPILIPHLIDATLEIAGRLDYATAKLIISCLCHLPTQSIDFTGATSGALLPGGRRLVIPGSYSAKFLLIWERKLARLVRISMTLFRSSVDDEVIYSLDEQVEFSSAILLGKRRYLRVELGPIDR